MTICHLLANTGNSRIAPQATLRTGRAIDGLRLTITPISKPSSELDPVLGVDTRVQLRHGFPLARMLRSSNRLYNSLDVQRAAQTRACIAQAFNCALQLMERKRHGIAGQRLEFVINADMRCMGEFARNPSFFSHWDRSRCRIYLAAFPVRQPRP